MWFNFPTLLSVLMYFRLVLIYLSSLSEESSRKMFPTDRSEEWITGWLCYRKNGWEKPGFHWFWKQNRWYIFPDNILIFFFVLKYASKKISYCDLATVIYSVTDLQQVNKKRLIVNEWINEWIIFHTICIFGH